MKLPTPSNFELAPAGNHIAVCYMLVDMGTQTDQFGTKHKVRIGWQLSETKMEDGRPFSISQEYTFSMAKASNLRKAFISWRGRDFTEEEFATFDMQAIIGAPCMLNVVHKTSAAGNEYATITSIAGIPRGTAAPQIDGAPVFFSFEEPDPEALESMGDWLKDKLMDTPEYRALTGQVEAPTPLRTPAVPVRETFPQAPAPAQQDPLVVAGTERRNPEPIEDDQSIPF